MSPISKETSSERAALNPSLQPQPHREHRHKKFHVRPAAYGEGYESFALLQSSSSRPPGSPAPPSIPGAKAIVENAPAPTTASLISKWEAVSEKEISGRAARNALRISLQVLTLLILLVLFWILGLALAVFDLGAPVSPPDTLNLRLGRFTR